MQFHRFLYPKILDTKGRFRNYEKFTRKHIEEAEDDTYLIRQKKYIACDRVMRLLLQIGLELLNALKATSTLTSFWKDKTIEIDPYDIKFQSFCTTNEEDKEYHFESLIELFDIVTQYEPKENEYSFSYLTEVSLNDNTYFDHTSGTTKKCIDQELTSMDVYKDVQENGIYVTKERDVNTTSNTSSSNVTSMDASQDVQDNTIDLTKGRDVNTTSNTTSSNIEDSLTLNEVKIGDNLSCIETLYHSDPNLRPSIHDISKNIVKASKEKRDVSTTSSHESAGVESSPNTNRNKSNVKDDNTTYSNNHSRISIRNISNNGIDKYYVIDGYEFPARARLITRLNRCRHFRNPSEKKKFNNERNKRSAELVKKILGDAMFNLPGRMGIVRCSTTRTNYTGTIHCVSRQNINQDEVHEHEPTTDCQVDRLYEWRFAFTKPQNDLYMDTRLVKDLVTRDGSEKLPYIELPLFQNIYSEEQIRLYKNQQSRSTNDPNRNVRRRIDNVPEATNTGRVNRNNVTTSNTNSLVRSSIVHETRYDHIRSFEYRHPYHQVQNNSNIRMSINQDNHNQRRLSQEDLNHTRSIHSEDQRYARRHHYREYDTRRLSYEDLYSPRRHGSRNDSNYYNRYIQEDNRNTRRFSNEREHNARQRNDHVHDNNYFHRYNRSGSSSSHNDRMHSHDNDDHYHSRNRSRY